MDFYNMYYGYYMSIWCLCLKVDRNSRNLEFTLREAFSYLYEPHKNPGR